MALPHVSSSLKVQQSENFEDGHLFELGELLKNEWVLHSGTRKVVVAHT